MTDERDDLFRVRLKPGVDFGACGERFSEDVAEYLSEHSEHYRRMTDRREETLRALEECGVEPEEFNRLTLAAADREAILSECFWAVGMAAAGKAAAQPEFDLTAFFAARLDSYKTPEYYAAVEALDAAYDAVGAGKSTLCMETLNQERMLQEQLLRQRVAANAMHGFEWCAEALEKAGMHIDDVSAESFYRIFR